MAYLEAGAGLLDDVYGIRERARRTALHVDFAPDLSAPSESIDVDPDDLEPFNAVGSLAVGRQAEHFPVLDISGGVSLQRRTSPSGEEIFKAILRAQDPRSAKQYKPESMLKDLLRDYGIELEVFTASIPEFLYSKARESVSALVLRSARVRNELSFNFESPFVAFDSSSKRGSHLFVQSLFADTDHALLIEELAGLGIVSEEWAAMTEREGMSIVRTPWTAK